MSAKGIAFALLTTLLVGCHRPVAAPVEQDTAVVPVVNEAAVPSEPDLATVDPKRVSPAIRKRSPEKLRLRIRETVARMQADSEPLQRRQALQRVADAVRQYQQQHGTLPADTSHLSWRVAVLPYLREERLSREFRQDEPWNSPHNESLVARMPKVLGDDPLGLTRCFLITDNNVSPVLLFEGSETEQLFWTQPAQQPHAEESVPRRIVLREGAVCEVDASVSLDIWKKWLRRDAASGETPAWLHRFPAQTVVREFVSDSSESSAVPFKPTLPEGTWCVLHLEPRRLLRNPHIQAVVSSTLAEPAPESSPTILQAALGPYGSQLRTAVRWMNERGTDPLRLESQTVVIPTAVWTGPVVAAEMFAVVCRAPAPFDVDGLITHEMELAAGYQYREQGSSSGIIDPRRSFAWHFSDDATALFGGQTLVASLSEAQPGDSPLTALWDHGGDAPVLLLMDCSPVHSWLQRQSPALPSFLQEALPSLREAEAMVLTFNPDSSLWGTLTIIFREAQAARNVEEIVSAQIEEQRQRIPRERIEPLTVREDGSSILIEGLKCEREGIQLRITMARPARWEALLQQLITRAQQKY